MQTYTIRYTTKKIISSDEINIQDTWMFVEAESFGEAAKIVDEKIGRVHKMTLIDVTTEGV